MRKRTSDPIAGDPGENSADGKLAEALVEAVPQPLVVLDRDLSVRSASRSFFDHFAASPEETLGRPFQELPGGYWNNGELRDLLKQTLSGAGSFEDFEIEGELRQVGRAVLQLAARRVAGRDLIVLAIRDMTEQRQQEGRRQAAMGELQHRVKNILSNVHALASQTRRHSHGLDDFFQAFGTRLEAFARLQDRLIGRGSEAVALEEVIRLELDAIGAEEEVDFSVSGPAVLLSLRDAQALAMAVHELTTNAAKYGALSGEAGQIEVRWSLERRDRRTFLSLQWRESGLRLTNRAPAKGFGSRLIEESLPRTLGGSAALVFEPDGVTCRLDFPLTG